MEIEEVHFLIYKEVSGNSKAKGGVGCISNKKYERFISKWSGKQKEFLW